MVDRLAKIKNQLFDRLSIHLCKHAIPPNTIYIKIVGTMWLKSHTKALITHLQLYFIKIY
jgi:hypothetical protein